MKKRIKKILFGGGYLVIAVLVIANYIRQFSLVSNTLLLGYIILTVLLLNTKWVKSNYVDKIRGYIVARKLSHCSKHLTVQNNVKIFHPECVSMGEGCSITEGAVLAPLGEHQGKKYPSLINIGNNVHIGAQDRIASMNSVTIEDDVLFAAFVHITDHSHEYREAGVPVVKQGVFSKGPVVIKRGAWLAFGCHILSGVTVGEYSVVAANSVVTKDVPPYTVVAGNPARVVSRYDFKKKEWVRERNQDKKQEAPQN